MLQFLTTVEFWALLIVLIPTILIGHAISDYRLTVVFSSILLIFMSAKEMLPIWAGILAILLFSLVIGLGLVEVLLPQSGGGGS